MAPMIDYHIHTPLCRHAEGTPKEYLREAERKGLFEIGFADHFPLESLGFVPDVQVTMAASELAGYIADISQLAKHSSVPVKLGLELDYLPGSEGMAAGILAKLPLDYVIGSLHFIDGWDFTHPFYIEEFAKRPIDDVYQSYFALIWDACQSGLFDIIGHIDGIKKFGYYSRSNVLQPLYQKTADILSKTGICLEVNTAGLDASAEEIYPSPEMISLCRKRDVPFTMGSDAHFPDQVARHFDETRLLLKDLGVKEITTFTQRRPSALKI